jgi:hypothetical protein
VAMSSLKDSCSPVIHLTTSRRPGSLIHPTLAIVLAIFATACASSSSTAARAPRTGKKLNVTAAQLQIKVRALADPFSGTIEEVVWDLWQTTDDPAERQAMLIWQINLINAIQRAAFQPNPTAALFDTWALVDQFRDYVVSSPSGRFTDEQRRIILDAADRMEEDVFAIAVEASSEEDADAVRTLIREWAARHPIDRFAVRASPQSEMASWSARADLGALATVKNLGATLDDVMARLDLYAEYVPKQASWHAQAIAYGWAGPESAGAALADLATTAAAFDRIASSLESYPEVVAGERRIILETVVAEREQILDELMAKIAELQLFVSSERVDLVEHQLRIEREAIFEAIASERAIIIAEAKQERAETMAELDEMANGIIERSAVKIVDHFFGRAVQLLAIMLVGLALIAVAAVVIWRRN